MYALKTVILSWKQLSFYLSEGSIIMKLLKKIFGLVLFGGVAYALHKMAQRDEVQETLFELLGEDTYLEAQDKLRLVGDLLMWPVDFVRALLP